MNDSAQPAGPGPDTAAEPTDPWIRLDQFLKFHGLVETGGQAKMIIQEGGVDVNDEPELRRGRKLRTGDVVSFNGESYLVEFG